MVRDGRLSCLFALVLLCASAAARASGATVLVLDSADQPVTNAVVWFAGDFSVAELPTEPAVVDQIDKQFVPQLTVIPRGAKVVFPNSDAVSHHVYSFAQPNSFELPLYKGGTRPTIEFQHTGVVTLGCNIHDSMLGYIVVVDTLNFAITDTAGRAHFNVKPDGKVSVWSPRLNPAKAMQANVINDSAVAVTVQVARRQRAEPKPFSGSLAWEDY